MDGREERDQPLPVECGMEREIQPHDAHGEDADQHLDDTEHLRHDVVELAGDLIVEGEEQLVLARRIDGGEGGNARHEPVDRQLPAGDVPRQNAEELLRLDDQRGNENPEQDGEPAECHEDRRRERPAARNAQPTLQHAGQRAEIHGDHDAEEQQQEDVRDLTGDPQQEDGEDRRGEDGRELEAARRALPAHRPFSSVGCSISACTVSSSPWPAPSALFC